MLLRRALSLLRSELELVKLTFTRPIMGDAPNRQSVEWRSKPIHLVELIYALYHSGSVGNVKLKDLFEFFENTFNIKLPNFSHTYGRIRGRGDERCLFLYKLLQDLTVAMELKDR